MGRGSSRCFPPAASFVAERQPTAFIYLFFYFVHLCISRTPINSKIAIFQSFRPPTSTIDLIASQSPLEFSKQRLPMAQSGGVHRGAFLCMNVSGSTDPTAKDPTRAQAHEAVLAAFKEAERSGARPSAILLQEYSWATNGRPGLRGLLDSLGESWKPVRQLEDAGVKDTAVLYDSAIYDGSGLVAGSDQPMACSPGNNMEFHVEFPARERQAILSYQGRWSGVHLGAIDPATGKPSLQFLLVSYHGRSNKRQTRNLVAGGKPKLERLPPKYKKALAQDFVAEVAKAALRSQVGFGVTQYTARSVPAVVAGDWNSDAESFENFTGLAHGTDAWACSHHLPTRPPGGGVRVSKEDLDYVVAINGDRRHEHSCELRIEAVQGLPHLAKHRTLGLFDHDPVLTTFTVLAVPVAATEQMGHGMRVAAEQAKIKILVSAYHMKEKALTGCSDDHAPLRKDRWLLPQRGSSPRACPGPSHCAIRMCVLCRRRSRGAPQASSCRTRRWRSRHLPSSFSPPLTLRQPRSQRRQAAGVAGAGAVNLAALQRLNPAMWRTAQL